MKLYIIEGDNNEDYEDHRNWFVGLSQTIEDAEALIESDLFQHLNLYYEDDVKKWRPTTEHSQRSENDHFEWNWSISGTYQKVTFDIWPYEFKLKSEEKKIENPT